MDLTISKLKEIIKDVPDDTLLSSLYFRDDKLISYDGIKRVLLLEKDGKKILLINPMGTHYFDLVENDKWVISNCWQ